MLSLKNLNFVCIKFGGPVLSELPVYLIWRSFQKIANLNLCEYVCVRAYVYVRINATNEDNIIVATCKTQYRVLLLEM